MIKAPNDRAKAVRTGQAPVPTGTGQAKKISTQRVESKETFENSIGKNKKGQAYMLWVVALISFAFLFFDVQYWIMATLPGSRHEMCVLGAGLNTLNVAFSILQSLLAGLFVVGFFASFRVTKASFQSASWTGLGALLGTMTVFCTLCTIPLITLFGLGISLGFITTYDLWFKLLSLFLLCIGLYQLNRKMRGACGRCITHPCPSLPERGM